MKAADMVGFEQGRLKVLRRAGTKNGKALWECQCSCGNTCKYTTTQLRTFGVESCGCLQKEKARELAPIAGRKRTLKKGTCLNAFNSEIGKNNTSGIKGVSYYKKTGKWRAQIRVQGKNYHLGLYDKIEDAETARKIAEENVKKWINEKK